MNADQLAQHLDDAPGADATGDVDRHAFMSECLADARSVLKEAIASEWLEE